MPATNKSIAVQMSLEQLSARPEFHILTPKQKMFVSSYVQVGLDTGDFDPIFSVQTAYQSKSTENARLLGYQLLANEKIQKCLNLVFGRTDREVFLSKLQKKIEAGKLTIAEIEATRWLAKMRGWDCPSLPNTHGDSTAAQSESKHFVDQIVKQNGNRFKVTAVDVAGKIIAVEPIL